MLSTDPPRSPATAALQANAAAEQIPEIAPGDLSTPCAPRRKPVYVLLSFAVKHNGDLFAAWLRHELNASLKDSLKDFSTRSVYLDNVAVREVESVEHFRVMPSPNERAEAPGTTFVAPHENPAKHEGSLGIGALNSQWNPMYLDAMREADVMLIVFTPDYPKSKNCMQEWEQYQAENVRRLKEGRPPLHGLVISFGPEEEGKQKATSFAEGKAAVLTVQKVDTHSGPTALGPGGKGWAIDDFSFQRVLSRIKVHLRPEA
jgi:hypothetical protein